MSFENDPRPWGNLAPRRKRGDVLLFDLFLKLPLNLLLRAPVRRREGSSIGGGRDGMERQPVAVRSAAVPVPASRSRQHPGGARRRLRRRLAPGTLAGVSALACACAAAGVASAGVLFPRVPILDASPGPPPVIPGSPPGTKAAVLVQAPSLLSEPLIAAWERFPAKIVTPDSAVGDAPNPFIMEVGGTYYMYSSQGDVLAVSANIPLRTSTDLLHWTGPSEAMPTMPEWARTGLNWSPDVHYIEGRYVMWFSAVTRDIRHPVTGDGLMKCIGWATSSSPSGPFVPDRASRPAICQVDRGGSIDPHLFVDPGGSLYLVWKSDDNALPGFTKTTIWSQRLEPDGTTLSGEPVALISADQPWENGIVENGQMVYADGTYWLFYSSNWFSSPKYSIDYDRCSGPAGPCSDPTVFVSSNGQGQGPGEAEVFVDASGGLWIAYAPWAESDKGYSFRPVAIARLSFSEGRPFLAVP